MATARGVTIVDGALGDDSGTAARADEAQRRATPAPWDPSLVELTASAGSRIPPHVEERWSYARHRADCGLLPEVRQAWVSVDSVLFLWDYRQEDAPVLSVPADSPIISVATCTPRPGIFEPSVRFLLVLATRLTVSLVGLHFREAAAGGSATSSSASSSYAPASASALSGAAAVAGGAGQLFDWTAPRGKYCGIQLVALDGYVTKTNGAIFHTIRHDAKGHIFLLCGAPQVFELAYSRTRGWFHRKCRLIRHFIGWWPWMGEFLSIYPSGRIRLLECAPQNYVFTADDVDTLRLYRAPDADFGSHDSASSLQELTALTKQELSNLLSGTTRGHSKTRVITHLFPDVGLDGCLKLKVLMADGERLHFICSAPSPNGPSSAGSADASICGGSSVGPFYGFWLQGVSWSNLGASSGGGGAIASCTMHVSTALNESQSSRQDETRHPCVHSDGVWMSAARSLGSHGTDVAITACIDGRIVGTALPGALDLHTVMNFSTQVLDISEEPDMSLAAFPSSRSFAVMSTDGVKVIRLSFTDQALSRPPATSSECRCYLFRLATAPTVSDRKAPEAHSSYNWMWSLDDARVPSFEEQQRQLLLSPTTPPVYLGRWFCGLLEFLSIVLRPVWKAQLVVPVARRSLLGFYKRRRLASLQLALDEPLVQRLLAQIPPVLRFASQGIAASSAAAPPDLSSVAVRSRLYSREQTTSTSGAEHAQRLLSSVVGVVDRVQQVLGFVHILQRHGCDQAVLQRAELLCGGATSFLQQPLRMLVATTDALGPVVQLCAALVVESGLRTSGRLGVVPGDFPAMLGADGVIYRELQEKCPAIFAQVDLSQCMEVCRGEAAAMETPTSDVLRQYVQCFSSSSLEDHWSVLVKAIQATAAKDPQGAADICTEKIQQLQCGDAAALSRARSWLVALLDALSPIPVAQCRTIIESVLLRISSVRLVHDASVNSTESPSLRDVILEHMLCQPRLHRVLESLVNSTATNVEPFLLHRYGESRVAAECLWKYYLHQDQPNRASGVLLQLADRPDGSCTLKDRLGYLRLAKEHATSAPAEENKDNTKVSDTLVLRLEVGVRIQAPLQRELRLLSSDAHVAEKWRNLAEQRCEYLQELRSLRELYETATEFSLFHIVLVVMDLSGQSDQQEFVPVVWVNIFCPPDASPYSPSELSVDGAAPRPAAAAPTPSSPSVPPARALFPLLLVRQSVGVLAEEGPPGAPGRREDVAVRAAARASAGAEVDVRPELFELRARGLLTELARATKAPGPLWDVRCIAAVLEYCSCAWFRAVEVPEPLPAEKADKAVGQKPTLGHGGSCGIVATCLRSWVALRLLPGEPFNFALADVVRFYAQMLGHLKEWARDLQALLPEYVRKDHLVCEDDLRMHLAEVVLAVLDRWVARTEASPGDARGAAEFREAWLKSAEGLLVDLGLCLNSLQCRRDGAKRLLPEVLRLEAAGRHLCGDCLGSALDLASPLKPPLVTQA